MVVLVGRAIILVRCLNVALPAVSGYSVDQLVPGNNYRQVHLVAQLAKCMALAHTWWQCRGAELTTALFKVSRGIALGFLCQCVESSVPSFLIEVCLHPVIGIANHLVTASFAAGLQLLGLALTFWCWSGTLWVWWL